MKFYLIHHAHTDIGYTDRQEKIAWNHAKYLESVVDILREAEQAPRWAGFCWNVETFWMLEKFLESSTPAYIADFWRFVREGKIGLSGSYLNGTDLTDETVLRETLEKCRRITEEQGVEMKSAMTADINGYAWGYASIMADAGIRRLLSAVHTHHGHYATGKKQLPFYWEGPDGQKLLVWQSEHYHLGNEINIHQLSGQYGYMIRDGLPNTGLTNWELSKHRLFAYAEKLKGDGFPFDFCPILVSGLTTDNSPPGPGIIEFVHRWNAENGDQITLEMTTLDRFFDEVEKHGEIIPTYRGDWTDWWADGTCSTPDAVSHYREAVRKYHICRCLDPDCRVASKEKMEAARYDLMLYAEHTWGFSSSISQPAHPMVNLLDMRKTLYAARANEAVSMCLDTLCGHLGQTPMVIWKDYRIQAVNPNHVAVTAIARTELEILFRHKDFRIVSEKTGKEIPYQLSRVARGWQFNLPVELQPLEHAVFRLEENPPKDPPMISLQCDYGADGVQDFAYGRLGDPDWACTPFEMITPFFHIKWETGKGIMSIFDRQHNRELITGSETAFEPIYEITPIRTNACAERRNMGRNRKALHTQRDFGRLTDAQVTDYGPVMSRVILSYEIKGSLSTELILTSYCHIPRLDVEYRLHKESRLEPENVYLALPFAREDAVFWADKTGCVFRPRIDQIPGTCADYYELQNGIAWIGKDDTVLVEMPDAPMISMGPLPPHDIRLSGDPERKNTDQVYAWVMNNFWETNFKASLGGFHNFRFALRMLDETDPEKCFAAAQAENTGLLCFPSFDVPVDR
ncbi:MAG: hypothetical protein IKN04_00355 [Clostridia bacterium]|nr:hypothetical protein [Clostridia bacterium]